MRAPHRIAAVLFAILVANPLCCCFAHPSAPEAVESHGCCAKSDAADHHEAPGEAPCSDCQVTTPRLADGGKAPVLTVDLVALVSLPELASVAPRFAEITLPTLVPVDPDPGPPKLRLVLRQSFLI